MAPSVIKKSSSSTTASADSRSDSLPEALSRLYFDTVAPIERQFRFPSLYRGAAWEEHERTTVTSADLSAPPIVLLLGNYSTGKTTFIQHVLGRTEAYPGAHVGPEPTTDRFVAVMSDVVGAEDGKVVPGHAAALQSTLPFSGLSQFGPSFLARFSVAHCNSSVGSLKSTTPSGITFIDTPGFLASTSNSRDASRDGTTSRRSYDYLGALTWFARKADAILLFFDAHKLDMSRELCEVVSACGGCAAATPDSASKLRIVLNKADGVTDLAALMRVYGALMWALGKVIGTPEVPRVYFISSKEDISRDSGSLGELIMQEHYELMQDILNRIPRESALRKSNDMAARIKALRAHAHLLSHMHEKMPMLIGKTSKHSKMLRDLEIEIDLASRSAPHIALQTYFPKHQSESVRLALDPKVFDLTTIIPLTKKQSLSLENSLNVTLPNIILNIRDDAGCRRPRSISVNSSFDHPERALPTPLPSESFPSDEDLQAQLFLPNSIDHARYSHVFTRISPVNKEMLADILKGSGLPMDPDCKQILDMVFDGDDNTDEIDYKKFAVAMHLARLRIIGGPLLSSLPKSLSVI